MKRIRLQIQIMPWREPGPAPLASRTRTEAEFKWCEPCTEDLTIQGLTDRITAKWAKKYIGYGPLDIKRLETFYGDLLDMDDTIGAYFDDRTDFPERLSSQEVLPTSVVQVYRFPPRPEEVADVQRYGSLMPESTARPRKRPFIAYTQHTPDSPRARASMEERDDMQFGGAFAAPNKRRRMFDPRTAEGFTSDQRPQSRQEQAAALHATSQGSGRQGSIHQVHDSQTYHTKGQSNPYGTPTSLSLVSPQEPQPRNQPDITSIPDSPTRRGAASINGVRTTIDLDRESTKSESPEIRLSVHDVPHDEVEPAAKRADEYLKELDSVEERQGSASASRPNVIEQLADEIIEADDRDVQQGVEGVESGSHDAPNSTRASVTHSSGAQRHSAYVFDEIASDTESFHEKQRMHSNKRLKIDHTSSNSMSAPQAPVNLRKDLSDGRFLLPAVPHSREIGRNVHDDALESYDVRSKSKALSCNGMDEGLTIQSQPLSSITHAPGENGHPISQETLQGDGLDSGKPQNQQISSSSGTVAYAQASDNPAKNWSDLDEEHPIKKALSQGRRPDLSLLSTQHARNGSPIHQGNASMHAQESQEESNSDGKQQDQRNRSANTKTKGRQPGAEALEKQRSSERDETDSIGKRIAPSNPVDPTSRDTSVATGAEQLIEAARSSPQLARSKAQTSARTVNGAKADKFLSTGERAKENGPISEKLSKEQALSKQAERRLLETDGAKQLQIEKLEKQKTPKVSSRSKVTTPKTPEPDKPRVRTEAQKQRRRELQAQRMAEQRIAADVKKPLDLVRSPFHTSIGRTRQSSEHIDTESEQEQTGLKRTKSRSSSRATEISKAPTTASITRPFYPPLNSDLNQNRKSLTPAIPKPAGTKSRSHNNSVTSSSPLGPRSSAYHETPLRSAFKQSLSSNSLRRSVSFLHEQAESVSALPPKSLVELNNELALTTSDERRLSHSSKPTLSVEDKASNTQVQASQPLDDAAIKPKVRTVTPNSNGNDSKIPVIKKDMVQQRLSVTRDNKMKGRANDRPTPEPKQEIVISSTDGNSASSSSSDEDTGNGNAKAGPSSRKKSSRPIRLYQDPAVKTNPQGTPIDPAIEEISATSGAKERPLLFPRSKSISTTPSQVNSISRSPAQAMSVTISVSSASTSHSESEVESGSESASGSGSGSGSDSDSDSDSKSNPLSGKGPPSATSSGGKLKDQKWIQGNDKEKVLRVEVNSSDRNKYHTDILDRTRTSSASVDLESQDEASQQLQLEDRESAPAEIAKTVRPYGDKQTEYDRLPNQGLDRNGRLPDGTRPAYFKFPKISAVRALAEAKTADEKIPATPASQKRSSPSDESQDSSSSSSDGSTSDTEGREDEIKSSQVSPKHKPGGIPGFKGVMKLARKIRGGGQ